MILLLKYTNSSPGTAHQQSRTSCKTRNYLPGWVTGFTEALIQKPKVRDFENLSEEILSWKGLRGNSVSRILLVIALTNLGSTIGTFVGIPLLASFLN